MIYMNCQKEKNMTINVWFEFWVKLCGGWLGVLFLLFLFIICLLQFIY